MKDVKRIGEKVDELIHFNLKNVHMVDSQASTSTLPTPQDQELKALVQRVLYGQIKSDEYIKERFIVVNKRIDDIYNELDGKITSLASHVKTIELQVASSSKTLSGILPSKSELIQNSFCNVVLSDGKKVLGVHQGPSGMSQQKQIERDVEDLAMLFVLTKLINWLRPRDYHVNIRRENL